MNSGPSGTAQLWPGATMEAAGVVGKYSIWSLLLGFFHHLHLAEHKALTGG